MRKYNFLDFTIRWYMQLHRPTNMSTKCAYEKLKYKQPSKIQCMFHSWL